MHSPAGGQGMNLGITDAISLPRRWHRSPGAGRTPYSTRTETPSGNAPSGCCGSPASRRCRARCGPCATPECVWPQAFRACSDGWPSS
ncbi:hypothetical protein QRB41_03860 [Mycobacterium avium subsp. hominissuis]|nr:hypothetical protein [Mycobacterium avium]MDO2359080.1 hypothetical protein [Mycobacterium avium subsp. hominissuis]MDO2382543.1 hypothetical protein [Mycobacterium avium subsp. hominissuis]MDO2388355.1 hypothetical protein [Mycobacterium avium subsp. hominissuis]MDO2392593.1 hypothetical protein [Mycobacterium avium subsp. hominissuis]